MTTKNSVYAFTLHAAKSCNSFASKNLPSQVSCLNVMVPERAVAGVALFSNGCWKKPTRMRPNCRTRIATRFDASNITKRKVLADFGENAIDVCRLIYIGKARRLQYSGIPPAHPTSIYLDRFMRIASLAILSCLSLIACHAYAGDWTQFRGPAGDGIANGQLVPTQFSESEKVTWKTELPGRAWSSPVISDGVVWLTTAIERIPTDEEKVALFEKSGIEKKKYSQLAIAKSIELKLIAVDFQSGSLLKTIDLTEVEQPDAIHTVNSYASPTPVIDGPNIYCHFGTYGTFCIDRASAEVVWKRRLPLAHSVGPGSSPFIYKDMLVLIQDGLERQYVTALNKLTGTRIWEVDRPEMDAPDGDHKKAFSTPIAITDSKGREQLICMASQWIVAHDPSTGKEIWKLYHGKGFSVVPRPVYANDVVYFSTGFGKPQLWAVRVDGDGDVTETHVLWKVTKGIPAKPSPLIHEGLIYVIEDNGVASCLDANTGEEIWKKRVGGKFSASPLLAGGHIYFGSHDGKVTVFKPGKSGEVVADNQLQGQIMASPAAVDNALVVRTAEALYRIED